MYVTLKSPKDRRGRERGGRVTDECERETETETERERERERELLYASTIIICIIPYLGAEPTGGMFSQLLRVTLISNVTGVLSCTPSQPNPSVNSVVL